MRAFITKLHRYGGLALAGFLVLAGLSGSIIVFYRELDVALNPEFYRVPAGVQRLSANEMARRVEAQLPKATISLLVLNQPEGRATEIWVQPKSGSLPYDQVFADPANGKIKGMRKWGEAGVSRAALMPMLYVFHYTLKLPGVWGTVLMGAMACLWTLDCLFAFILTLPRGKPFWTKWSTAWRIKRDAGSYRFNFDLHRAGGLWLWGLLLLLATSGVGLNLHDQVFRPIIGLFATLKPDVEEVGAPRLKLPPAPPLLDWDDAVQRGRELAQNRPYTPRYVFHFPMYHAYGIGFGKPQGDGMDGWGLSYVYFDDRTGKELLNQFSGEGRAGDIYVNAQYQLHSGRILGWPGRILIFFCGIAVAVLSITGVYIWLKKLRARQSVTRRASRPVESRAIKARS